MAATNDVASLEQCKLESNCSWSPRKCTYSPEKDLSESPHRHQKSCVKQQVWTDILKHIGNTPMVRLNRIGQELGIDCEIYGKCEFLNPGGSIKDRIALRMVEEAEVDGRLKPGDVIIEPTSGNTGVGMALVAAVKGYRCIIVLPENMSMDKVNTLKALGAEVVRTKAGVPYYSPLSHLKTAYRMKSEIPNAVVLDQYQNPYNTIAHFDTTANEILDACGDRLDMLVMGVGTGGSITGIARKVKSKFPDCKIVGVDPEGSIIAGSEDPNNKKVKFEVEGIGYDFIPQVFDDALVDKWYKCRDKETFLMARRLMKEEGLLVGGSSGAAMYNALKGIQEFKLTKDHRCVVILPDTIRNYLSKFVSDEWMRDRRHLEADEDKQALWWWNLDVDHLALPSANFVDSNTSVKEAIGLLQNSQTGLLVQEENRIIGRVNSNSLMTFLTGGPSQLDKTLEAASPLCVRYVERANLTIGYLSQILEVHDVAVVKTTPCDTVLTEDVYGVATKAILLNFLKDGEVDTLEVKS